MTAIRGGDVTAIGRAFGRDPATLLDFSANVNPLGPPEAVSRVLRAAAGDPSVLAAYPDPHARELVETLARREGVAADTVIVANGGAAVLDAAVRAVAPRRCVLPVPAFSEYARALAAAGAAIVPFALHARDSLGLDRERLLRAVRACGADACIVSNPHNPSGRGEPAAAIDALVRGLAGLGCTAIVDEAFVDYAPELSVLARQRPLGERTVVLRSLTKFFAIPGLRVGYGFAAEQLAAGFARCYRPGRWGRSNSALPWPCWVMPPTRTRRAAGTPRHGEAFARDLRALGCRVFPPAANFVLCDVRALCDDAVELRARLIREHGIVIRTFDGDPALGDGAYVRLAVRRPEDNARLVAALHAFRKVAP